MSEKTKQFPIGASITIEQMDINPYPIFQQLMAHEPVSWVPAFNFWIVTRRADVLRMLRDAKTYTMEPIDGQINPMEDTFGPMMLSLDGPKHKKIREVFVEPYRPRHCRNFYSDLIAQTAEQLISDIAQQEVVDLDKEFSDKLAVYVVVATLGFPVDDLSQFRTLYDDFGAAIGNVTFQPDIRERGQRAFQVFNQLVLHEIEKLKARPNDSVLSQIVHDPNNQLTIDEIVSNVALTFFGGVETTSAMLSNTLWALLKHPDQLEQVKTKESLLAAAIEEALRWEAPVQSAMRFPTQDVVLHDVPIAKGEKIYCILSAANRDPAFFDDPDIFDVHRPNANKHLSFASGPHFCFGSPLARLEAQIGLRLLFDKLPNMRLIPEKETPPVGHEFRATPTLYVRTNACL
ncbi:MAG: cytochrome P450 [Chloroflexota bacterium]